MPVNPLITKKVKSLDVPDDMKSILLEVLKVEDSLEARGEQRNAAMSMGKILERHADKKEVVEFCERHE